MYRSFRDDQLILCVRHDRLVKILGKPNRAQVRVVTAAPCWRGADVLADAVRAVILRKTRIARLVQNLHQSRSRPDVAGALNDDELVPEIPLVRIGTLMRQE